MLRSKSGCVSGSSRSSCSSSEPVYTYILFHQDKDPAEKSLVACLSSSAAREELDP